MQTRPQPPLDVDSYFDRLDDVGERAPSFSTLARLQRAHATTIPFENLDIHLGLPIRIDLASVAAKLIEARRGGYCFEQNTLFAAALEALGFSVSRLAARVRLGQMQVTARTHMILAVGAEGRR